jgi:hypothetical protein
MTRASLRSAPGPATAPGQAVKLSVPDLEQVFKTPPQATIEDVLAVLSDDTLNAILAEMPDDDRFTTWQAKVRKTLAGHNQHVAIPVSALVETR